MLKDKNPKEQQKARRIRKKKIREPDEDNQHAIWKLAYADFMTAMMTFFLVMWLMNSTAKEKIVRIADYFNPIKLSDPAPFVPGVREAEWDRGDHNNVSPPKLNITYGKPSMKPASVPLRDAEEEALLRDPFSTLELFASQAETALAAAAAKRPDTRRGDSTSRDPFAVYYIIDPFVKWITGAWRYGQGLGTGATASPAPSSKAEAETTGDREPANADNRPSQEAEADTARERQAPNPEMKPSHAEERTKAEIWKRAVQIENEVDQLIKTLPKSFRPDIAVKAVHEGVLISLTDGVSFNMFKISSAVPSPPLVFLLGKLGRIINEYPGPIIIRGHTDGRLYAEDRYGNWRLSVNRATMTYYMLLRGKVSDNRFLALKGYAERDLKNKADPLAGENRRIEILIRLPEEG